MSIILNPPPIMEEDQGSFAWQQWYLSLQQMFSSSGSIAWSVVDKTGASLTDIPDRKHNDLQSIQGGTSGEYYHLTSAEYTAFQNEVIFKTISVSGQSDVVADSRTDTLTLVAGTGITITTNATTDSITFTGGYSFGTVSVSGQSDVVADQANDVLTLVAGTNITLTTNAGSDSVTISAPATVFNFGTISVSGQSDVVADTASDTLTLVAGTNMTITTNASTDTITINMPVVDESDMSFTDVTTLNVTSTKHGFTPKSLADATKFLNSDTTPGWAQVKDSDLALTDITTNNVSSSKHGFTPKAPNNSAKFLDGTGAWSTPGSTGSSIGGASIGYILCVPHAIGII